MGKKLIIKGADFSDNGILPEFVELKSIIATATTQFITSPVRFPKNGKCVFDAVISSGKQNIFGFSEPRVGWGSFYNQLKSAYANSTFGVYFANSFKNTNITYDVRKTFSVTNWNFRENGRLKAERPSTLQEPAIDSVPFGIFGVVTGGYDTPSVSTGYKLYSFKMYSDKDDDNSLILDAIPVKRTEDNVICLYDKISGEYLLTDDGTNPDYEELD